MDQQPTIHDRILHHLDQLGIPYEALEHGVATTAAEAAELRGTPLELGVKAILFKVDGTFALFAMNAARAMHSAKIRKGLNVRRTRFATRQELDEMTGLRPGSVPPFGEPVLPFPLYVDPSVFERPELVFTAGSRTRSLRLASEDYRRAVQATVLPFTR